MELIPFTHFVNILSLLTYLFGGHEYVIPLHKGVLLCGTIIAYFFPKGISEKYGHSIVKIRFYDFFTHWLPVILTFNTNNKNTKNTLFAIILPVIYFSHFGLKNPIDSLQKTYPKVPLFVFTLYFFGVLFF